jgi:hypothetical protein
MLRKGLLEGEKRGRRVWKKQKRDKAEDESVSPLEKW